jgi:hypothetical protein
LNEVKILTQSVLPSRSLKTCTGPVEKILEFISFRVFDSPPLLHGHLPPPRMHGRVVLPLLPEHSVKDSDMLISEDYVQANTAIKRRWNLGGSGRVCDIGIDDESLAVLSRHTWLFINLVSTASR